MKTIHRFWSHLAAGIIVMATLGPKEGQADTEAVETPAVSAASSAAAVQGKPAGTPAATEDCAKDAKTKADEKLKADLDNRRAEEKAAEAQALQKLGLVDAQKPSDPSSGVPAAKMETCK